MASFQELTHESEDDLIIDNDCDSSPYFTPAPWCGYVDNLFYLDKYKRLIDRSPFYSVLAE